MNKQEIIKNILNNDSKVKELSMYEIFNVKIQKYLLDEDVNEIMFNGINSIFIEKNSKLFSIPECATNDELLKFIDFVSRYNSRKIDYSNPIFDGKLPDGSRCSVVIEPISQNGTIITIRKHKKLINCLNNLITKDMFSLDTLVIIDKALNEKKNIIISGGTSSGKTTLINAMLNSLKSKNQKNDRIIIIEDTKEIALELKHVISLQTRLAFQGNNNNYGEVTMGDLVKASLRMRPDRLIIGEVRGSEAYYLLHALNTGHKGSISSIHANSARDALRRLETLSILDHSNLNISIVRNWISSNIHLIMHLDKINGTRCVKEVSCMEGLEPNSYILRKLL